MVIVRHPGAAPAETAAAVQQAAASLTEVWARSVDGVAHRISPSQLRALGVVRAHGTTNITQLAEGLGAIKSSASRLADRLVAAGFVTRRTPEHDRRESALELTATGEQLLAQIEIQRRADLAQVLDAMSEPARAALLTGLEAFDRASREAGSAANPPGAAVVPTARPTPSPILENP